MGGRLGECLVARVQPSGAFRYVFAEWKAPTIKTTPAEPGPQIVGFRVGLGGDTLLSPLSPAPPLLQAGTAAGVTGGKEPVSYWAWYEWVPKGGGGTSTTIKNFELKPGDVVSVLVCAPETNHGFVSMLNHRTNFATSVGVKDPTKDPYDGSTVEWCVEAPSTEMPSFGSVTFTNITAGTHSHVIDLSNAGVLNALNPANFDEVATGKILSSKNEVVVTWKAAD
jgi:hypothetical protein